VIDFSDHVYLLPAWAPTIYSVARIMEFLPSEGVLSSSSKGKGKDQPPTRVRLAWFYRQSDVSDKPTADTRQLLAAIYSEVANVTQLQGKCYVSHRERISDLAGWKKRPDHFYFTRLFDPYIKREFEVLQASAVRNSAWKRVGARTCTAADISVMRAFPQSQPTYARCSAIGMNTSWRRRRSSQT
jgi:hypothetical protein